jgi:hypothetical protein
MGSFMAEAPRRPDVTRPPNRVSAPPADSRTHTHAHARTLHSLNKQALLLSSGTLRFIGIISRAFPALRAREGT